MAKIYRNLWAGYETYFVPLYPVRTRKHEAEAMGGYSIINLEGKWTCKKSEHYNHTIHDAEHFPVVGEVKINILGYVKDAMLAALGEREE